MSVEPSCPRCTEHQRGVFVSECSQCLLSDLRSFKPTREALQDALNDTEAERDALRAELERTKEELEAHRKLENVVRVMIQKKWHEGELSCEEADVDDAFGEINTVRAAHRRKDGASHGA